jgi:co-chaperonin GroES (HSP10)
MIRPLDNRLMVEPLHEQTGTKLWVPGQSSTQTWRSPGLKAPAVTRGRVVAIGPGKRPRKSSLTQRPVDAQVGDVVHFSDSSYRPFQHDGKDYGFIREDDIAYKE